MILDLVFDSFEDAFAYYNVSYDTSIKIIDHPRSLERFERKGKILYHMGIGPIVNHGYPKCNQLGNNQIVLFNKLFNNSYVNVFYKNTNGQIKYAGKYIYGSSEKKIANNGFTYYEFMLLKID